MSVDTLIRSALDGGVLVALVDGKLRVTGKRSVIQQWRPKLTQHKAEILRHLSDPEPTTSTWREAGAEYRRHHFKCAVCIAGGQGRGLRCGTGTALWAAYQTNFLQNHAAYGSP